MPGEEAYGKDRLCRLRNAPGGFDGSLRLRE
jgi:hypothetical protein